MEIFVKIDLFYEILFQDYLSAFTAVKLRTVNEQRPSLSLATAPESQMYEMTPISS